ncbi:MAG: DoxX family protein [Bacteroidetes bacterium]|nr:DoxX family protein [Bacteroidota bacterium]
MMCFIFLFSAFMYFTRYDLVEGLYGLLGFPSWLIYPMAGMKILGVTAVLTKVSPLLKEWAYAGFFFDSLLTFTSHHIAADGQGVMAAIALLSVIASRYFDSRMTPRSPSLV